MPGQVVAVASGKGGVGKTTTVVNLGVMLRRTDHSVALVDADLGMANLGPMLGVTTGGTLHEVLAGEATLEEAVVEEAPGFAVLRGSQSLTEYPDADPQNLPEVLEALAEDYEFVLVDTGAGMGHEDVLPLGLADRVLLVSSPDPAAIGDTRKTAELAGLANGDVAGLVVTKAEADTDPAAVAEEVGFELLGAIPYDGNVRESTAAGRPLEAVDPDGPAAGAYRELAAVLDDGSREPPREVPSDTGTGTGEPATAAASSDREPKTDEEATQDSEVTPDPTEAPDGDTPVAPDEPTASDEEESAATEPETATAEPSETDDESTETDEAAEADPPAGNDGQAETEEDSPMDSEEDVDQPRGFLSRLGRLFRG